MKGKGITQHRRTSKREAPTAKQHGAKVLDTLSVVASAASGVLELDRVLNKALDQVITVSTADKGAIHLLTPQSQELTLHLHQGLSPRYLKTSQRLKLGEQVVGKVAQTGRPIVVKDSAADPRATTEVVEMESYRSLICWPLRAKREILGTIAVYSAEPRHFTPADVRLVRAVAQQLGIAIENARLFQEKERRVSELAALNEIGQAIGSTLSLTAVLKLVAQKTAQVCDVERCSILLLDKEKQQLVPMMSQFASGVTDEERWRIFKEETSAEMVDQVPVMVEVIREGRTVVLDEASKSRLPLRWTEPFNIQSLLLVPLTSKDETIGLMALDYTTEGRSFSPEQVDLATTIGSQVAIGIENARLYGEVYRRAQEVSTLLEVSQAVCSTLDLQSVLEIIAAKAKELLDADTSCIFLLDEKTQALKPVVALDPYAEHVLANSLKVGEGITGWVAKTGVAEIVNHAESDPRSHLVPGTPLEPECLLSSPLPSKGKVIGAMTLSRMGDREFKEQDLHLLISLANQAAIAMDNAELYDRERKKVAQLQAINRVGQQISSMLDLDQMLSQVVKLLQETSDRYNFAIFLMEGDSLVLSAGHGGYQGGEPPIGVFRVPMGKGIVGWVAEQCQPLLVNDVSVEPKFKYCDRLPQTRSELAVPIKAKDRLLGVLDLESAELSAFDQTDLETLSTLADQLGIGIENARLYEREKKRAAQLSVINEVGRRATSILVLDKLPEEAVKAIQESFGYHFVSILMVDEKSGEVEQKADASPYSYMRMSEYSQKTDEGLIGWAVRNGELLVVNDVSKDPRYLEGFPAKPVTKSELVVPIKIDGRVVAVLDIQSGEANAFEETDRISMQTVADQLSVAMQNAQLFQQVAQSDKEWEDTFKSITDGIAIHDAELRILRANPAWVQIAATTPEALVGKYCYEVFPHCVGRDSASCPHHQAMKAKEAVSVEVEEPSLGKTFHISCFPVFEEGTNFKGMVHTVRDVTEQKVLRAQLLQTEKLAAIGQLISGVAHELNNPLTSVMGYAQLLQTADVSQAVKEDLRRIYKEAQRSAKIIENLLTFARKEKAERRYVDINQILRDTLKLRAYQLKVDNIESIAELDAHLPWTLAAPDQLQQVFLNLLNNAHQAMLDHRGGGRLTVRSQTDGEVIRVQVIDNGPGIPQEIMGRLFDPFFTTKEVGQGTGLGLSIAFGIVQGHGGRIWAESEVEEGATFTVELPVIQAPPDWPTEAHAPEKAGLYTGGRILLIDDEEEILKLVTRVLNKMGHEVVALTKGETALEHAITEDYDLIISDVKMPGMAGQELYQRVKKERPELIKRIIFITGDTVSDSTRAFLHHVTTPFVTKPFKIEDLQWAIRETLKRPGTGDGI